VVSVEQLLVPLAGDIILGHIMPMPLEGSVVLAGVGVSTEINRRQMVEM